MRNFTIKDLLFIPNFCISSGDSCTLSKVANYLKSGYIMREESLQQASLPCKPHRSEIYEEEFYCVETTGAKVTLSSSVSLIYFYCSRLPSDGYMTRMLIIIFFFLFRVQVHMLL